MTRLAETAETKPGLRERNRRRTTDLIIETFSELSVVNPRFTMQELADAAGISVRTLYRYYANREELVAGLFDVINRRMTDDHRRGLGLPKRGTEHRVHHSFKVFSEHDALMRAVVLTRMAGTLTDQGHEERSTNILGGVVEMLPDLSDLGQRQLAAVVRLLGGSVGWFVTTDGTFDLDTDEASDAVVWALRTLMTAAMDEAGELK